MEASFTGIDFTNKVANTEDFNIFLYRNFYNGGGVAIGDLNNDGWPDVYFTSNMGANALFLNKGNFKFEDITMKAGVASADKWSTGVSLVDINADGWLDIYVCNAGYQKGKDQKNELYINNKDQTFTERAAEYGLDENGYTTHAAFFDYDKDGDLDAYILNNSFMPVNTLNYSNKRTLPASEWPVMDFLKGGGDRLLRNDNGRFNEVTVEAGIYNSLIGFGLGITIGDVNNDGWDDIYISNDFFERDYLYINQKNGTFREEIKERMNHISAFSMGADMADINNDGNMDIFVTDMLPSDPLRLKTTSSFEDYNIYQMKLDRDFYHQYMHNTLQINRGDGQFSEIAYMSGVAASDWSWGALLFDIDNDGYKDIYVSNGIFHDVTNQDFIDFFANDAILKMALSGKKIEVDNIIGKMPSVPVRNKVFMNKGDMTFDDISEVTENEPSFSNGAAYGDLDNDGDLDLVVNNVNQSAFVLKNVSRENHNRNYVKVRLNGPSLNPFAIGAKVTVYAGSVQTQAVLPYRGFQSSVESTLLFGLDSIATVDSVSVLWPDLTTTVLHSLPANSVHVVDYQKDGERFVAKDAGAAASPTVLVESDHDFDKHHEDAFVDYYNEGLLIKLVSREGPRAAVGDVNGDGAQDIYFGGARNQPGRLYIQSEGKFVLSNQPDFLRDSVFEDTACEFFDADGDGDLDLMAGSGGNYTLPGVREMQDRVYVNDGAGKFTLNGFALPNNGMNTATILPFDFDSDGDTDVFVGSRSVPGNYGVSPRHFLYRNDGKGKFKDVLREVAPEIENIGMVTDAVQTDADNDGKMEIVIVGEWMGPRVFRMSGTKLQLVECNLSQYSGWWSAAISTDVDHDGDQDLVLGNRGENFYFSGSADKPAKLWVHDFDDNNTTEKIITTHENGNDYPVHLKKELTQQIISLKKQNLKYSEFATKSMSDLFESDQIGQALVREANYFRSVIAYNDGNFNYRIQDLPAEVQFSCVNSIMAKDLNGDGFEDLVLVGNRSGFLPQFSKLDASYGNVLLNDGKGRFATLDFRQSGFTVKGDATDLLPVTIGNELYFIVLINDSYPKLFRSKHQTKKEL